MEVNARILEILNERQNKKNELLSEYATKNSEYKRRKQSKNEEPLIRQPFFRDADRIIHSKSFARYIDKTQVFFLVDNDHITHRVLHVQLVSKISRTIGRALGLNEDLLEAVALGHDIGHVPYGHLGEKILTEIGKEYGLPDFKHNIQSVRFLDTIEDKDLTIQVLDGILCHNGEILKQNLKPDRNFEWDTYDSKIKMIEAGKDPMPMTLEGCVVRVSDLIAYLGRDLQDALEVKLISDFTDIPEKCKQVFKHNCENDINWLVIETLIKDLINNSFGKDEISFSKDISECVEELQKFNYTNIYENEILSKEVPKIEHMYKYLFEHYYNDYVNNRKDSLIFKDLVDLSWVSKRYLENSNDAEIVRDFLAGMTDRYFEFAFNEITLPKRVKLRYEDIK